MPIDAYVFYNDQLANHKVGAFVTWQPTNSPKEYAHWTVDNSNNKVPKTRPEYEFNPGLWIWDWRQWCGLEHHNFPLELNAVNFRNAFINLLKLSCKSFLCNSCLELALFWNHFQYKERACERQTPKLENWNLFSEEEKSHNKMIKWLFTYYVLMHAPSVIAQTLVLFFLLGCMM